jgi:transketolase
VTAIDGNDIHTLRTTFNQLPLNTGKPSLIIANTVKGKGVSYMEDQKKWHHGVPTDEQYALAMEELDGQLEMLRKR